jgi:hypothetical protein
MHLHEDSITALLFLYRRKNLYAAQLPAPVSIIIYDAGGKRVIKNLPKWEWVYYTEYDLQSMESW